MVKTFKIGAKKYSITALLNIIYDI